MPNTDQWLLNPDGTPDPFASNIDFSTRPEDLVDPDTLEPVITDGDPVLAPHQGLEPTVIQTQPVEPPPPPPDDEPEVLDLEDGTQLELKKDKGWWVGSVVGQIGSPQVYKGATKNKLILEVLKAQANATKKIREQNTKLKLGTAQAPRPQAPVIPAPQNNTLTADEVFEIQTQLQSNPALALDNLFQKQTGLTVKQLVDLAQEGRQANIELKADSANRAFLAANPDYYPDADYKNIGTMIQWLAKFKLGKIANEANASEIFNELVTTGNYTAETLEEAFEDLSNDGFLITAPRQAPPVQVAPPPPVVVQQEPVQPAPRPDSRIVRQETRPRAATGIRTSDITPVAPPATPQAPSADDLENMTDEEHTRLWNAMRRERALSRRS